MGHGGLDGQIQLFESIASGEMREGSAGTHQNGADQVGKHGHEREGQDGPPLAAPGIRNVRGPIDDDRPPPPSAPDPSPIVVKPRRAACVDAGALA